MTKTQDILLFNQLFTEYQPRFVLYANTYVRDMNIAEDLVNEAFMKFWINKDTINIDSNIPAYILTILKNKCLNHLRHKEIENKAFASIQEHLAWELQLRISTLEASDPEELFSSDLRNKIDDAISRLPEKTMTVFKLSRLQNKSNNEIARMLGITTKGVEFHITKALSLLRKALKGYIITILLCVISMAKYLVIY